MLSVGSRDGNGGFGRQTKGLGFGVGGEMEDTELEEGEACYYQDDETTIDPDIALSYIDEKLQDVLGHFQKDFEGGVSAENLGAKFGGYGSFLPTYQRSPSIWSHPKTPQRVQNCNSTKSPNSVPFEGVRQNPMIPSNASIPGRLVPNNVASGPTASVMDNSTKRDMYSSTAAQSAGDVSHKYEPVVRSVNGTDQKTLKVRIKVGSDNISAQKKAEICSGLGLDISPSSSLEESPDESGRLSPKIPDSPDESPLTILKFMTSFHVPGGSLLSPLPDFLLRLSEKEIPLSRDSKPSTLGKGNQEGTSSFDNESLAVMEKGQVQKKTRVVEKKGRPTESKTGNSKDAGNDTGVLLKKEIDIETPAGRELVSNALKLPLLSSSKGTSHEKLERQSYGDAVKVSSGRGSDSLKETNRVLVKDIIFSSDSMKEEVFDSGFHQPREPNRSSDLGNELAVTLKVNSKSKSVEKVWEDQKASSHKDSLFDPRKDGGSEGDTKFDTVKDVSDGFKGAKDHNIGTIEPSKQKSSNKAVTCEQGGVKMQQGNEHLPGGKKKSKDRHSSGTLGAKLPKEKSKVGSSVAPKEKKKSSHSKDYFSETQLEAVKPQKESSKTFNKYYHRDSVGDFKMESAENRIDSLDVYYKDKSKDLKLDSFEMEHHGFVEKSERLGGNKIANPLTLGACTEPVAVAPALAGVGPNPDAANLPVAPVVIEENWVCCDRCQKWRLLPFGTDPDHLPKKWLCSMLTWLPGKNRCSISEEETTKALNALYQIPIPENQNNIHNQHDVAVSGITLADVRHLDQSQEQSTAPSGGKKKHTSKDTSIAPSLTTLSHHLTSLKNQQSSTKSRSLNNVNQYTLQPSQGSKVGLQHIVKENEFPVDKQRHKQKEKHKLHGCYSDGGDYVENSGKHSKTKSKRDAEQDASRISKKVKAGSSFYTAEDWHSDHDFVGKAVPCSRNGLMTKLTGRDVQKYNDYSSSKDSKCDAKENLLAPGKKQKDQQDQASLHAIYAANNGALDMAKFDKMDHLEKKRKVKELQEGQVYPDTLSSRGQLLETSGSEMRKEKKPKLSKSEGKESSTSKAGRVTRILLSGSRDPLLNGMVEEGRGVNEKEHQLGHCRETKLAPEGIDSSKRDLGGYMQPSLAATSSSSKVSGSRKTKANFREVKGSPVESVSSSPLRNSNADKLTNVSRNILGKDDATNVAFSIIGSPRRCSDGEYDGGSDRSGLARKEKASSAHDSLRGEAYGNPGRDSNQASGGKIGDNLISTAYDHASSDPFPTEFENHQLDSGAYTSEQHNQGTLKDNYRSNGSCQRKSGKSSHSRSREKQRGTKSEFDKGKVKVFDSFSNGQGNPFPTKNTCRFRYEGDIEPHNRSPYHEELRAGKYGVPEKCRFKSDNDENQFLDKDLMPKWPGDDRKANQLKIGILENSDVQGSPFLAKQHKDPISRGGKVGTGHSKDLKPSSLQNLQQVVARKGEKSLSNLHPDKKNRAETASVRGKSKLFPLSGDKHETESRGHRVVSTPHKGSRREAFVADALGGETAKFSKQPRKADNQSGAHYSSLRHPTPNGLMGRELDAPSPIRKDSSGQTAANNALREAKDLKHTADRLKNGGDDLESTTLYFQAALKFLHGASLLEPCNVESAKHGETTQSMQVYADTAKLCEFCAHEYERCREMAAAALAYKCMEVAYMRVMLSKHSSASKDRHELQASLQMVPHGESPSSSASDVDNLNNHGVSDKTVVSMAVASPQVASNHIIVARNRPNFVRLLNFAQLATSALEASKKSQNAFAAANGSSEEARYGLEVISSIRRVLDFNFHDVEGLLRLVRLAVEAISR